MLLPVAASQRLVTNVSAIRSEEERTEPESVSERGLIPHRESAPGCFAQCVQRKLSNELKVWSRNTVPWPPRSETLCLGYSVGNINVLGHRAGKASAPALEKPFKTYITCCLQECFPQVWDETFEAVLDQNLSFPLSQGWSLSICRAFCLP